MPELTALARTDTAVVPRTLTLFEQGLFMARDALVTLLGSPNEAASLMVELENMARKVPDLHKCTPESVCYGAVHMASLGLNPAIPNEVWMIPRDVKYTEEDTRGRKVERFRKEAITQYGYGGLRTLVMNSPEVVDCFAADVRKNDTFEPPSSPLALPVHRVPGAFMPRGPVIGYYASVQLRNGYWRNCLMSVAEIENHKARYVTQAGPAWSKGRVDGEGLSSFDKMALKTVLRMLCNARDLRLTPAVAQALQSEEVLYKETAAEVQGYGRNGREPAALTERSGVVWDMPTREQHTANVDALFGDVEGVRQSRNAATGEGSLDVTPTPEPETEPDLQPASSEATADDELSQLTTLHQRHGLESVEIATWFRKQRVRFKVNTLRELAGRGLLKEAQDFYAAQDATPVEEAAVETESATEVAAVDTWRDRLASQLTLLKDEKLGKIASGYLEDDDVTDKAGEVMLLKVLDAIDAEQTADGAVF